MDAQSIDSKFEQFHKVFDANPIPFMLCHLKKDARGNYCAYEIS